MSDTRFMALALSLGRRGRGQTWPNPAVGCVIVNDGVIVGRGATAAGGRPHAETQALSQAGARAEGADVYVTLEPCAHHGQTPPCAQALIAAKVARVVVACGDSDPRVAGLGAQMVKDAGIAVEMGVLEAQARADHAGFFMRVEQGRPFVILKLATSFDGRIATASGESQWITAADARRAVHMMRSTHDAVMVGGGTARKDDPSLNVRDLGITRQPARVVLSRQLDLPLSSKLAQNIDSSPLFLCHGPDAPDALQEAWRGMGATLLPCGVKGGVLDMNAVLQALGSQGLTRIFCEGGGAVAASLLQADVVDELVGFTAGVVIGADGLASIGNAGVAQLARAPRFVLAQTRAIGPDVLHIWTRRRG